MEISCFTLKSPLRNIKASVCLSAFCYHYTVIMYKHIAFLISSGNLLTPHDVIWFWFRGLWCDYKTTVASKCLFLYMIYFFTLWLHAIFKTTEPPTVTARFFSEPFVFWLVLHSLPICFLFLCNKFHVSLQYFCIISHYTMVWVNTRFWLAAGCQLSVVGHL